MFRWDWGIGRGEVVTSGSYTEHYFYEDGGAQREELDYPVSRTGPYLAHCFFQRKTSG